MSTQTSLKAFGLWPIVVLLAAAGCSTTGEKSAATPSVETSVSTIADRLVRAAELRTDLRSIRTCIHAIREAPSGADRVASGTSVGSKEDRIGRALEKEFILALANHIYVVDSSIHEENAPGLAKDDLGEVARRCGATHVLVGYYVRRAGEIELSIRLVDTDSRVIVAATRGAVPIAIEEHPDSLDQTVTGVPLTQQVVSTAQPARPAVPEEPVTVFEPTITSPEDEVPESGLTLADTSRKEPGGFVEDLEPWRARKVADQRATPYEVPSLPRVPTTAVDGYETWHARRLEERSPSQSPVLEPPAQPPMEDFATWRARRFAERAAAKGKAEEALQLGDSSAAPAPDHPWRTPKLAELLGMPPDLPVPDPPSAAREQEFPWRTRSLAELLDVPDAGQTGETSRTLEEKKNKP